MGQQRQRPKNVHVIQETGIFAAANQRNSLKSEKKKCL